ncbi:helix-turn-helix transcriptional regulator [Phycicoccus sp. HDW14]|uniref:helix-turn-helix transcriptional regulator n=1 Tax=Phycicoccus sp. HDW14 TaxID=2714941 RepID=UPI00140D5DA1|nr:helix-turn-helix transcriptional regulator [Phycicoccus sp. HDW14]QIM21169.1 helix-turn-helix transcriptional regulator [Phycicoccus sp. HDW14]
MPGPAVERFLATVHPLLRDADPALSRLGERHELVAVFGDLEARTRRSLWNMQVSVGAAFAHRTRPLNASSRARGIEERMIHDRTQAARLPLVTTYDPHLRVGSVSTQLMVLDERYAVLPGAPGTDDTWSAFGTADPDLVALARAAFLETWEAAVPWSEAGLRPPLPQRRFDVAMLLVDGRSDREIAGELGISARTVSLEVRAVIDWLGARSRSHAVAMLVGAA